MSLIERNRGALIRNHNSGIRVVMYVDEPGVYYDGVGKSVDESVAKMAGFDVKKHAKERKRSDMRKGFESTLDVLFSEAEEKYHRLMEDEPDAALQLDIKTQDGKAILVDGNGNTLAGPTGESEARMIYKHLTGHEYGAAEKAKKPKNQLPTAKEIVAEIRESTDREYLEGMTADGRKSVAEAAKARLDALNEGGEDEDDEELV